MTIEEQEARALRELLNSSVRLPDYSADPHVMQRVSILLNKKLKSPLPRIVDVLLH